MIMQHHRLHISNIFKDIKISDEKKNHIRTVELGMKHFSAKWVPLILAMDQKRQIMTIMQEI